MIRENLLEVREKVLRACKRAGRDPQDVTLIAVSKTKPVEDLCEAMKEGQKIFGENKVQEIMAKQEYFQDPTIEWHMIGHLQRNKVHYLIGNVALIHAVDSIRLAEQIEQASQKAGVTTDILLEVNMAREESKFGFMEEEVCAALDAMKNLAHVNVRGLMTIAPFVENAEENRPVFQQMYKLFVDMKAKTTDNIHMDILSMGMTGDYEVAIEEGATMVRVGTGIFGSRNYNI